MTPEQFEKLWDEFLTHEKEIMNWKRNEYSSEADCLQNFREVAEFIGVTPAEIALVYLMKHIQSIKNAVIAKRYHWEWETNGKEGLKQRIADARNYLMLLAGCLEEESKENDTLPAV